MFSPIQAIVRPFARAIVLTVLWNNREEVIRWVKSTKASLEASIAARSGRSVTITTDATSDTVDVMHV